MPSSLTPSWRISDVKGSMSRACLSLRRILSSSYYHPLIIITARWGGETAAPPPASHLFSVGSPILLNGRSLRPHLPLSIYWRETAVQLALCSGGCDLKRQVSSTPLSLDLLARLTDRGGQSPYLAVLVVFVCTHAGPRDAARRCRTEDPS